jgi:hypothetical protein
MVWSLRPVSITLGIPGNNQVREYSIYSTEQDDSLEVLIKEWRRNCIKTAQAFNSRANFSMWTVPLATLTR